MNEWLIFWYYILVYIRVYINFPKVWLVYSWLISQVLHTYVIKGKALKWMAWKAERLLVINVEESAWLEDTRDTSGVS